MSKHRSRPFGVAGDRGGLSLNLGATLLGPFGRC